MKGETWYMLIWLKNRLIILGFLVPGLAQVLVWEHIDLDAVATFTATVFGQSGTESSSCFYK